MIPILNLPGKETNKTGTGTPEAKDAIRLPTMNETDFDDDPMNLGIIQTNANVS